MTLNRGVYPGKDDHPLYVGWAKAPAVDRRFLLGAVPALLAGAGGGAYAIAAGMDDPGAGAWLTGQTESAIGTLALDPYPMLRVDAPNGGVDTVLIVAEGKCTSGLKLAGFDGARVRVSGVLIERKGRRMLEVPLALGDWIAEADGAAAPAPAIESLGAARLAGMIMDSKCFFGVMRPSRGRAHKGCASLCIRGGIPPSFWARDPDGREAVLLMTDAKGGKLGDEILPLVAESVVADGEIVRVGDLYQFRADAGAYRLAGA